MQLFLSQVINGVGNGVIYGSVALALVLIFRTTGLLNFAQGEMALFSTFTTWRLSEAGLPIGLALLVSMGASFVAGVVIERVLIRPVEGSKSPLNVVIVTLGMFLAINSLTQLVFGTDPQVMPSLFPAGKITGGGLNVNKATVGLAVVLVLECVVIYLLLQRTRIGLSLRAVASNPDSSRLVGIPVGVMLMVGWGLSAAIGALAGSLVAATKTGFDASLMQGVLVYAFAAAAVGGFDSIVGAVVGGLLVGVTEALAIQYVDALSGVTILVPFGLILLVLLVKPNGLFGRKTVERV